jgi:hypothetical protein
MRSASVGVSSFVVAGLLTVSAVAVASVVGDPGPTSFVLASGSEFKLAAQPLVPLGGEEPPSAFHGEVRADGTVLLPAAGMQVRPQLVTAAGFEFEVELLPNGDGTGTVDTVTGRMTAEGDFRIAIRGSLLSSSCAIPSVRLRLTTDHPEGVAYDSVTRTATLLDDTFDVPPATNCGWFTSLVNSQIGLPSPAGQNRIKLVMTTSRVLSAPSTEPGTEPYSDPVEP